MLNSITEVLAVELGADMRVTASRPLWLGQFSTGAHRR